MTNIAQGLIKTYNDKRLNLHTAYVKEICEHFCVHKENLMKSEYLYIFADYSAMIFHTATESMIEYNGGRRDLLEISLRIQNLQDISADCPAYLKRDILRWLKENSD